MKKSLELISSFNVLHDQFRYLHSYHYSRKFSEDGGIEQNFIITLCNYPYYENDQILAVTFLNVFELKIGNIWGILNLYIDIVDISKDQLEGIRFKVKEDEEDSFSFYCQTFEFEVV
ncbi:hypothetical protein AB4Z29_11315 [Paenibacillus sp. 2TAB23]|uniref:hypothetical protein n=1 Tax=Paenibacillus sp. 2TAB23 TaxID=3233004 RepID=UPI003F980197